MTSVRKQAKIDMLKVDITCKFSLAKPSMIKNFSQPSSLRHLATFLGECTEIIFHLSSFDPIVLDFVVHIVGT